MCKKATTSTVSRPISFQNATGPIDYSMTNDYMFRAVLQKSNPTLEKLIASLLHLPPESILSVEITNPIELGKSIDAKTFFLDIKILLNNYTRINLEMQVVNRYNWAERSLIYLCRTFDSLSKGEDYAEVSPAIHIGFLNFTPFPEVPEFYATHMMLNIKNHHVYSDKFRLSVVDLTKINLATKEDKEFHIDYWASLFKATTWKEVQMLAEKYTDIRDTAETLYELNAEENIRLQCQTRDDYYAFQHKREVKIKQTEAQLAEQQKANADLQNENTNLQNANADLQNANADLQNANADLQNANADLQNANAEQAAKIEYLSSRLAKYENT
ncbi:MAG: Rpn family recombination-promoting nuclease/putative transposase [Clostridiales bacterium]|nr:Rpn family recombination-promoting nuclease/putative transposase [Clostridiales bacterium]